MGDVQVQQGWAKVLPYRGVGFGMRGPATDLPAYPPGFTSVSAELGELPGVSSAGLEFHGHRRGVGARLRHDSVCTECGVRFTKGVVVQAELAPEMAGTFRHTDCADPQLEHAEEDE